MTRDPTWLAEEMYARLSDNRSEEEVNESPDPVETYHPDELSLDKTVEIFMDPHREGSGEVFPESYDSFNSPTDARLIPALQMQALDNYLDIDPQVVYHPGCRTKVTPSAAFPESDVLYLDIEERSVQTLENSGYAAVQRDAEEFDWKKELGRKPDVVYMKDYTGGSPAEVISGNEKSGQWIFADRLPRHVCNNSNNLDADEPRMREHEISERMENQHFVNLSNDGYLEVYNEPVLGLRATKIA